MSHDRGRVYAMDDETLLGFFEYDGTCDVACTTIVATDIELHANWRSPANMRECACTPIVKTPVILYSEYGCGFDWESHACLACKAITGHRSRFDAEREREIERRGHPFGFE